MAEEFFEIVDDSGKVIGTALRSECHGNPALIHRTAHVVVFSSHGDLLLQKRSATKDIQPGKWDTAVGGHLDPGEDFEAAARREMAEELGLDRNLPLNYLFAAQIRNKVESENVGIYSTVHDGPFAFAEDEIDEVRFWSKPELEAACLNTPEMFTPNLLTELGMLKEKGYW